MPRQNRVTPDGTLIAVPDRGMFWGNRGVLHDPAGRLVRYSRGRAWAICLLEFKGRRRQQWAPGRLTELYFLDEATGLAAGHRPCGECRYRDYQAFKRAWAAAFGGEVPGVAEIDARLHADRLARPGVRRTYSARAGRSCRTGRWPRSTARRGWSSAASCWPGRRAATGSDGRGRARPRSPSSRRGPRWPRWRRVTARCSTPAPRTV